MNDRELLEMAAKTVGKKITKYPDQNGKYKLFEGDDEGWGPGDWNPLYDDGDALRLAASLCLEIIPGKHAGDGCSVNSRRHEIPGVTVFRDSKDMAEQMRRAVVMAAAEIGKSMP